MDANTAVEFQNHAHVHAQADVTNLVTNLAAKADKITGGIAGAQVSGMLSPDATGSYSQNGTYNGSPAFERVGGGWWLRYDMAMAGSYYWRICQGTSVTTATPRWNGPIVTTYPGVRPDPGSYTPVSGASGIATVAASQAAVDYLASYDSNGNLTLSILKTDVPIKTNGTFTLAGKVQEGAGTVTGSNAHANKQYQRALSSGRFAASGDSQYTETVLRRATLDTTPAELTIDGAAPSGTIENTSNRFICAMGKTYACLVMIAARKSDGTSAFFLRQVLVKNVSNTVSLDGIVQTVGVDINSAGWSVPAITADNMNKSLAITVTGVAATSIRWSATIQAQEIAY